MNHNLNTVFYHVKPFIPRYFQLLLRRKIVMQKRSRYSEIWPVDASSKKPREPFKGWPDHKQFSLVLTHDVDTNRGQAKCRHLIKLEKKMGFKSSYNFVPERYAVSPELRQLLVADKFEVGVHGLYHDGKLYRTRKIFKKRAGRINRYLNDWCAVGFRSPAMHHNLEWLRDLNIEYDASTFDTDPFEPQPHGVGTIFPFWVTGNSDQKGYVELPYTLPQDFTLFILMQETTIDIWKKKLDWIAENGGMALVNTHPDYMNFDDTKPGPEEYPAFLYEDFLKYIKETYGDQYWHALPKEVAQYFREQHFNNR